MVNLIRPGIFYENSRLIANILRVLDGLVTVLLLAFLYWFFQVRPEDFKPYYVLLATITFLLTIVIFSTTRLYKPWRGANLGRLVRQIVLSWTLVVANLAMIGYVTKTSELFSRRVLLVWIALTPMTLMVLRFSVYLVLRWARARGMNSRSAVIAGAGDLGKRLATHLGETISLGIRLLGFFDDRLAGQSVEPIPGGKSYPVLGSLDNLKDFVQKNQINMVYLALPLRAENRLRGVVEALRDTTASVYFVPDVFIFSLLQAGFSDLRGIPLISLWETPFCGINGWLKRAEDLIMATLFLLCLWPLMLFIALGVKFSSPGPIFFKQRRYGLDGEEFWVYKFRSMRVCEDQQMIPQATRNDPRVTRFGAFLRRLSLDELPQLLNVVNGTMSLVGPRPHAVAHNEFFRTRISGYMLRHKVQPGLTGWAQVNGWRGETQTVEKMKKRIEHDLEYIQHWSLWLDLKIIFLTVFRVLKDRRAY